MRQIHQIVFTTIIAVMTGFLLLAILELAEKNSVGDGGEKHNSKSYEKVRFPSYVKEI